MLTKYAYTLLFVLVSFTQLNAAIFVVTSNADNGTGTLREAIVLANSNGSLTKDFIHFNLPFSNDAERTITLETALPHLSSNLVIDGTTQPGLAFGVSSAKVIIQMKVGVPAFDAFVLVNTDGFELYGCYIRDFIGLPTGVIYVEEASNIQLGAAGKGNVFSNVTYALYTHYSSIKNNTLTPISGVNNLKVIGNLISVEPDGKSKRTFGRDFYAEFNLNYCKGNIEFGGPTLAERNYFGYVAIGITGYNTSTNRVFPSSFSVQNNYFGFDTEGNYLDLSYISTVGYMMLFDPTRVSSVPYTYSFKVLNNKVQQMLKVSLGVTEEILFQGNTFTGKTTDQSGNTGGVALSSSNNVIVGGTNPGEANVFYQCELRTFSTKSALVQRNTMYCYSEERVFLPLSSNLPSIEITEITPLAVVGKASPLSQIELFWDDDCRYCHPQTYFTTVTADANGLWRYDGPMLKGVLATATLNGFTSNFTRQLQVGYQKTLHSTCDKANGSITSIKFQDAGGYVWRNAQYEIIATTPDLLNVKPGVYTLSVLNSTCTKDLSIEIKDYTPKINDKTLNTKIPSCGASDGYISGLVLNIPENEAKIAWKDAGGNVVGTTMILFNLKNGSYTLEVSYNNCSTVYGPVVLNAINSPTIDQDNVEITGSSCTANNGSITKIAVTGTSLNYKWFDSNNTQVGSSLDLVSKAAGKYRLEVSNGTTCGTVSTPYLEIPALNAITINDVDLQITNSNKCKPKGQIVGITTTNGTIFLWKDSNGTTMGTNIDLINVPAGMYTLEISNSFGCSTKSKPYQVLDDPPTTYQVQAQLLQPSCGLNNGIIELKSITPLPSKLKWLNESGQTVSNTFQLTNVGEGKYAVYFTDMNDCEALYDTFTLQNSAALLIDHTVVNLTNDVCGQQMGSITAPSLSGGKPPYLYEWRNSNNEIIGTSNAIKGLANGNYSLKIGDSGCSTQVLSYQIANENEKLATPIINDVKLCNAGLANIQVQNPQAGIYQLFNKEGVLIAQSDQGTFNPEITTNQTLIINLKIGTCESEKAFFEVTIGKDAIQIVNTFSPNQDGINDLWEIKGLENYPKALVNVYGRNGMIVFSSIGYKEPFNGKNKGIFLPSGTYYYFIDLNNECGKLSGALTILR